MSIVVTGAAGFIGSNIIRGLNQRGISDILAVDDLSDGDKFRNLADLQIADYIDHPEFYIRFADGDYGDIDAVFHEGACSDTMESDGRYMMANNFEVSKSLFLACQGQGVRLLYASSAATYGGSDTFIERPEFERPLNVYGYSKLLFDQWVRRQIGADFGQARAQVAGFRYSIPRCPLSNTFQTPGGQRNTSGHDIEAHSMRSDMALPRQRGPARSTIDGLGHPGFKSLHRRIFTHP